MRPFEYVSPTTLREVFPFLTEGPDGAARPLAGGTDLLPLMKLDVVTPVRLVNIKQLGELTAGVTATERGLTLGALTTLADIETSPVVRERWPILAEAATVAATPQLRNMATVGGNLLQRPRCWYYRNPLFHCWLKGGEECPAYEGENALHALFGGGPCYAVHPSDLAPALLALDAEVRLRGPSGERTLPLAEFFALPAGERRAETVIHDDELMLSVHVPPPVRGMRGTYLKAMDRNVWAFALVAVAAVLRLGGANGRRIEDARLVLGGVAPVPWRCEGAEQELVGSEVDEELFARAAERALVDAVPLQNNAHKIPLAKTLLRRALRACVP
jgi:xanthine dehydrogenase YagS FAD-binding subunit